MLKSPLHMFCNVPGQPARARHHVGYFAPCPWEVQGPKALRTLARPRCNRGGGSQALWFCDVASAMRVPLIPPPQRCTSSGASSVKTEHEGNQNLSEQLQEYRFS